LAKVFIIVISLLFTYSLLHSQSNYIKFDHISVDDGLSTSGVNCIFQDSRGYLWFGTMDYLHKYNGYEITSINQDHKDTLSLGGGYIYDICEDNNENLWVATANGIKKISMKNGKINRFDHGPLASYRLRENTVNVLHHDQKNNLWIGTINGLDRLSLDQNLQEDTQIEIKKYQSDTTDSNTLVNNNIQTICEDSRGNLWIGTRDGLHKYNSEKETFSIYRHNSLDSNSISHNYVRSIFEDSEGFIWIGTWRGWLNRFDPENRKFTHYKDNRLTSIVTITEDLSGNLWFGAYADNGLICLEKKSNNFRFYKHNPDNKNSLSGNLVSDLLIDKSGILWIANRQGGINIYDPNKRKFEHYYHNSSNPYSLNANFIWSICGDNLGKIWFAFARKGVDCFDPHSGEFIHYKHQSNNPNTLNSNVVNKIYTDKSGILWIGTARGLNRLDPKSKKISQYISNPSRQQNPKYLTHNNVLSIFEDKDNYLWVGTWFGLNRLDKRTWQFTHYYHDRSDPKSNFINMITEIYEDRKGILWINTNHGLYTFNRSNYKFIRQIIDPENPEHGGKNFVSSFAEDRYDNLWFGTMLGLIKQDNSSGKRTIYTTQDGLPGKWVIGILVDDKGYLWLSTNKGLCRFDPTSETFRNYKLADGLQSLEFNGGAFHKSNDGYLYFGGINGFNRFYPDSVKDNSFVPPIVISSFKLLKQDRLTPQFYDLSDKINLTYDQNEFKIEFVALNFTNSSQNQYAYILEGFDSNWIYNESQRTATYTNLDPGAYVFRVKGSNNDGIWNEEGTSLNVIILPPWWRTNFAYFIYFIIVGLLIYLIWHFQLKRIRIKHQLEIEHKLAEQYKEIDRLKSHFFANISHEFRTPLTLILSPIEQLINDTFKGSIKNGYVTIRSNAKKLLRLVNQLLSLSKLEAGQMQLQVFRQDIVPVLKRIINLFSSLAERNKIEFNFTLPNSLYIYFDEEKIETVINNLLSNAFKFTPEDGKIEVSIISLSPHTKGEKKGVEITVSNTGIPITKNQIAKIFDRFYQVESNNHVEGTGIGLSLTKELVELHRGSITVESTKKGKTTFTIFIPTDKKSYPPEEILIKSDLKELKPEIDIQTDESRNIESDSSNQSEVSDLTSPTILLVEDNEEVRNYLRKNLENKYQILEAENGKIGIAKASANLPELIISDVMMPEMDGFEFCEKIKNYILTCHIPVILLTARATKKDKLEGLKTGADDYLPKPFDLEELFVRIENLIHQRKGIRERFLKEALFGIEKITLHPAEQQFVEKVILVVNNHIENANYSVEDFAKDLGLSRAQLYRKIKSWTNQTPLELIRTCRLKKAAELLKSHSHNVTEAAFAVGFKNTSHFIDHFKKQFGKTPKEFI